MLKSTCLLLKLFALSAMFFFITSCAHHGQFSKSYKSTYQKITAKQGYFVKKGDTLYSISFAANKDYRAVAVINHLKPPFRIHAGDLIILETHRKIILPKPNALERAQIQLMEPNISKYYQRAKNNVKTKKSVTIAMNHINKRGQVKKNSKVFSSHADNMNRKRYDQHDATCDTAKRNLAGVDKEKPEYFWRWPAKGKVVGTFSLDRVGNKGLDIGSKEGSPIWATAPGTVVYCGSGLEGYGNLIIIKHNARYLSAYAFNKKLLVNEGMQVKAGQQIATMGRANSGLAQLHFEIRRAGKPVDPRIYLS